MYRSATTRLCNAELLGSPGFGVRVFLYDLRLCGLTVLCAFFVICPSMIRFLHSGNGSYPPASLFVIISYWHCCGSVGRLSFQHRHLLSNSFGPVILLSFLFSLNQSTAYVHACIIETSDRSFVIICSRTSAPTDSQIQAHSKQPGVWVAICVNDAFSSGTCRVAGD